MSSSAEPLKSPKPPVSAVLAAVQRRHALQDAPAPGVQGVAGKGGLQQLPGEGESVPGTSLR